MPKIWKLENYSLSLHQILNHFKFLKSMIISEVKGANLSAKYVAISSQKLINDLKSNGFELSGFQTKKKGS